MPRVELHLYDHVDVQTLAELPSVGERIEFEERLAVVRRVDVLGDGSAVVILSGDASGTFALPDDWTGYGPPADP